MNTPKIDIDTSQIPEHIRLELLSIVYDATVAYFRQPGVEEKFQRWKAEKARKAAEAAGKRGLTYETEKEPCIGGA